jgi:CRP/FNR family transcriptional regulator
MNEIYKRAYFESMRFICPDVEVHAYEHISPHLLVKTFKKKEYVFDPELVQKEVGYIIEGLVRAFYVDSKGNEISTWFCKENEYVTDYPSFLQQKLGNYFFQVLEPSTIVFLPKIAMDNAYEEFPGIQKYGRLIAEIILNIQHERLESFLFMNAKERYLNFVQNNKELLNRISISHMASLLGIERQSLTRIRKELFEEGIS